MILASSMDLVVNIVSLITGIVAIVTLSTYLIQYRQNIKYWFYIRKLKKELKKEQKELEKEFNELEKEFKTKLKKEFKRKSRKDLKKQFKKELKRKFEGELEKKLEERLPLLSGTSRVLKEGIEDRKNDKIYTLIRAVLLLNDWWHSPSNIGRKVLSNSDAETDNWVTQLRQDNDTEFEKMPNNTQIYREHLLSIWKVLSFYTCEEALSRGYVTVEWLDAAEDWVTCLTALDKSLRNNPVGRSLSDAPAVALLERVRALSAEGSLFSPAKEGDIFYFYKSEEETIGPYYVAADPVEIDLVWSSGADPQKIIPLLQLELEDCTGERKELRLYGSTGFFAPLKKFTPGERELDQFPPNLDESVMLL